MFRYCYFVSTQFSLLQNIQLQVLEALSIGHFLVFLPFLMSSAPTTAHPLCCGHRTSGREDSCSTSLQTGPWSVHAMTAMPFLCSTWLVMGSMWHVCSCTSQLAPSLAGQALLRLLQLSSAGSRGEPGIRPACLSCSWGHNPNQHSVFCRLNKPSVYSFMKVFNNSRRVPDARQTSR